VKRTAGKKSSRVVKDSVLLLKGRLRGYQRMQMYKLLDMLYTPRELAQEVGFTQRQVYRVYLPAGCPHERDTMRRAWINGRAFCEWYEVTYPRVQLEDGEAFCLTCRKPVSMGKRVRKAKGYFMYWLASCPNCGRRLAKIIANGKGKRD
jgi:nitrite reductase/ring-hydroxylating ferredoxin subunit